MKFSYLLVLLMSLTIISCGDDATDDPTEEVLTGKVRGLDFTYGSGRFIDYGDQTDEFVIRIDNAGPMIADSCDTNSDDAYITLDVKKETGKKDLFSDLTTGENISVVFHHPDIFQNLIVSNGGWYDIKSFTTDELVIEFDINRDAENSIKGSCTVYRCN